MSRSSRVATLVLLGALALPAYAAKKQGTAVEPEKPTAAAPAEMTKKEVKKHDEAFSTYLSELASGSKTRSADALVALVADPTLVEFHGEAFVLLGDILLELSLPYAALCSYARAFQTASDTNVEIVSQHVPKALEVANSVGDLAILEAPFAGNLGLARTEDVRGQMAFLAAKEQVRGEQWGTASAVLKMVREGDPLYADAKVLEGVVLNQQKRSESALGAFDAAGKAGRDKGIRWHDSLQINLARTWYGAGNYPRAIEAYSRVTRKSDFWPDAQFERSWAHFRIDDYNGALAQLLPFDSAFFQDWYYPEADLLRIYSMFLVCKFPESSEQIEHFKQKYLPVHTALKVWKGKSEAEVFDAARAYAEKGELSGTPEMLWRPWKEEERFRLSRKAVDSADDELKRMKAVSANPFSEQAREWLKARRDAVVASEGRRVRDRFGEQEAELADMLTNSEIFILDILRMKTQLYEQSAAAGKLLEAATTVKRTERVRKGWQEWPFEDEYWADELGYYRVDVIPECPASMRQSVKN